MTAHMKSVDDVPEYLKDQIKHFFEQYKALEKGKWVKVEGWAGSMPRSRKSPKASRTTRSKRASRRCLKSRPFEKNRASPQGPRGFSLQFHYSVTVAPKGQARVVSRV